MSNRTYNCTGCIPIDKSIVDTYVTLLGTNKMAQDAENERAEAELERTAAEEARATQAGSDHTRAESDHSDVLAAIDTANTAAQRADDAREAIRDELDRKQDVIEDLDTIRSNAAAGATAYHKPSDGIPASDIASGVIPDVSNFITKAVDDLTNYYLKSETYTKAEVQALINAIKQFTYQTAQTLPTASADTMHIIYLVPSSDPQTQNVKDEYITIDNGAEAQTRYTWEQIGSTAIDLSGYVTTTALNTALANYTTTADLTTLLAGKQDVISDLDTIRSGAAAGATAYQKPSGGIPASDMASGVQTSLGKADAALPAADVVDNLTTDDATKALSAKQGKVLDGKVSQLGQDVYGVQGQDMSSQLLTNKSIKVGDYSIGDTVPTTPVSNSGCYCIIIPVHKGDIFKLTGNGGSGPRLWGQLDKNNVLKALYSGPGSVTDLLVTIEYDGYFVVNFVSSGGSVIQMPQEGLIDKVENLETKTEILDSVDNEPTENSNNVVKSGGIYSTYNGTKETVNGTSQIDYTSLFIGGKAIVLDVYNIGDVVNITPTSNGSVRCQVVEVKAGDIFIITGFGGSGPRLWGQLDAQKHLMSVANSNVTANDLQILINQNGYLVVNILTSSTSYSLVKSAKIGLVEKVANLQQQLGEVPQEISNSLNDSDFQRVLTRGFISEGGTPNSSSYRLKTNILPQKEHTISLKSGFVFYSIVLYDSNGDYVSGWEPYSLYSTDKITVPVSSFKYSGEYRVVYSIRRVVEDTSETITTDFDTVVDSLVLNDIINKDSAVKISKDCGDVDLSSNVICGSIIDFSNKNVRDQIGSTLTLAYSNCHLIVPCRKGDLFKITANYDAGNAVAFTDNNRIITYKYNVENVNRVLSKPFYAPTDGYLYVNSITYDGVTKELFLPKCIKFSTNRASYKPVRWAALGDSITISYYSKYATAEDEENDNGTSVSGGFCNTYAYIAASIKNAIQDNYAKGSTGWLQGATPAPAANSCAVVDAIDFSNYDLVTFAYGINDYKAPSQILGTFSDGAVKDVSVVSCMRYCIEKVIAGNPACKIVVLTPLNARGYGRELGNESTNYAIGAENSLGYTLQDLYDKIVEVCEYYGIEYVDWTHKSVINRKSIAKLTPDGVHPSKEAQEILGRDLATKLLF